MATIGAQIAARKIVNMIGKTFSLDSIAEIIDEETGSPEMLKALELFVEAVMTEYGDADAEDKALKHSFDVTLAAVHKAKRLNG